MCLGIPGRIVEIVDAQQQRAVADVDGVRREISLALLGIRNDDGTVTSAVDLSVGGAVSLDDWVLIHVGFAMSRIDEDEAAETLRALRVIGGAYEQEIDEYGAGGAMDPLQMLGEDPSRPARSAPMGPLGDPAALPPP